MAMVPKLNTTQFDEQRPFTVVAPFEPMVTARVTEQDRIEGIKAGADAYLVKPFNTEELLTVILRQSARHLPW